MKLTLFIPVLVVSATPAVMCMVWNRCELHHGPEREREREREKCQPPISLLLSFFSSCLAPLYYLSQIWQDTTSRDSHSQTLVSASNDDHHPSFHFQITRDGTRTADSRDRPQGRDRLTLRLHPRVCSISSDQGTTPQQQLHGRCAHRDSGKRCGRLAVCGHTGDQRDGC